MIAAFVGVSQARAQALTDAGQSVPQPVPIQAMLDTGASNTCVDPGVLDQLGLSPTGVIQMVTPSTGSAPAQAEQYDVSLVIFSMLGHPPLLHLTIPVTKSHLHALQGFHALIGRDVLKGCLLAYDGQSGLFSLAY
jgi:hypothetical protein